MLLANVWYMRFGLLYILSFIVSCLVNKTAAAVASSGPVAGTSGQKVR